MPVPTNDGNIVKRTSQYIDNVEHDETTATKGVSVFGTPDGISVYRLKINSDGSISTGLTPGSDYDYIDIQQTSATVDTYVFKLGGAGGTTKRTIVVTYTSSAKTDLDTVVYT